MNTYIQKHGSSLIFASVQHYFPLGKMLKGKNMRTGVTSARYSELFMVSNKEKLQDLIKRIDHLLKDGVLDEQEFRDFEILILESLRAILQILSER